MGLKQQLYRSCSTLWKVSCKDQRGQQALPQILWLLQIETSSQQLRVLPDIHPQTRRSLLDLGLARHGRVRLEDGWGSSGGSYRFHLAEAGRIIQGHRNAEVLDLAGAQRPHNWLPEPYAAYSLRLMLSGHAVGRISHFTKSVQGLFPAGRGTLSRHSGCWAFFAVGGTS